MEQQGQVNVTPAESDEAEEVAGNIELKLPRGLHDLLRRLSGVLRSDEEAVTEIPDFGGTKYGVFFQGTEESSVELDTRSKVRLKILEAVGKCKTLKKFNNWRLNSYGLSFKEWEALLIPMQNNVELEDISLRSLDSGEREEEIGPLFHNLVRHAHNLTSLTINGSGRPVRAQLLAAVASGLRVNGFHKLKKLDVREASDDDASVLVHVAEIISLAPELNKLKLERVYAMDGNAKEAFTAALKGSANLRRVTIGRVEAKGIADVLAEVYGRTWPRPFLDSLTLWGVAGLTGDVWALLTGSNIPKMNVTVFSNHMRYFNMGTWQSIGTALLQHPLTLSSFKIEFRVGRVSSEELQSMEGGLRELWRVSERSPLLEISIRVEFGAGKLKANGFGTEASNERLNFLENAIKDTYLRNMFLSHCDVSSLAWESFVERLASNTSVRSLNMWSCKASSKDGWAHLFRHLRENTSIAIFGLLSCDNLNHGNFREFMDLLQVNFTLLKVDLGGTEWAMDGKEALVQEVLQRNKKLGGYFSILGEANLPFGGAKAGRIFMCGAPFAGKTQLKATMMNTMQKASKSESLTYVMKQKLGQTLTKLQLLRTKGIEVELLCDDPLVTISIWDFAGQEIFRALQNMLFPKINQGCIFLFVFNPFKEKRKDLKENLNGVFAEELRSWLRFIVSNTRITGRILPQVFIIVTHVDKLEKRGIKFSLVSRELENAVEILQVKFQDVVHISPQGSGDSNRYIHYVNATHHSDVQPITNAVVSSMRNVLDKKSSKVPIVCSELVSILLRRPTDFQHEPLWSSHRFYNFCLSTHPLLENFKLMDNKGKSVLRAVASYMHDAGAICMTPSTVSESEDDFVDNPKKLIVVDMNWLTQNLLGQLISIGHGFETSVRASTSQETGSSIDHTGFINDQQLTKLIGRILDGKRKHIDEVMVRELLLELDFCYILESAGGVKKYFMPIIFSGGQATSKTSPMSKLKWSREDEGSDHFGYRLQCQDSERTSFTPALFPRYQIHLRKEMQINHGVVDENFIFSLSYVEIRVGGCSILVEIDESRGNHIDIMVKVSKLTTREWAMNFVRNHIVRSFFEFCASEKGCPGMQLVQGVLRTECVKKLTPRELRKECQSILLEDLKRRFQIGIESQLQDGKLDRESIFGYIHDWPEIGTSDSEFHLSPGVESAHTLMSSGEVIDIVTAVHKNHKGLLRNLEELREISTRLDNARKENPCFLLSPSGGEHSSSEEFSLKGEHKIRFLGPLVARSSFQKREDLTVGDKLVLQALNEVQENMMENFAGIREELRHLQWRLKEMQSLMFGVNSRVDSIIRFKISEEKHRCPRRPYFSPDVSLLQRMKGTVLSAHAVRLHLMCEARNQPHFVKDQPGLQLLLQKDGEFAKWMRRMSVISLNMIWVLLKIGVQVTAGLGSVVPDISNLVTGISIGISVATVNLVLDELKLEVEKTVTYVNGDRSFEEAWMGLRNYLAPHLTSGKCAELFSLYMVRYKDKDDPYAWLCEPCMLNARRNFLLE